MTRRAARAAQTQAAEGQPEAVRDTKERVPNEPTEQRRKRRWWPLVVGTLFGVIAAATAAAAVFAAVFVSQAISVKNDLEDAKLIITQIGDLVEAGDVAGAEALGAELQSTLETTLGTVNEPLWQIAADVPVVGQNVEAVRRVSAAVQILMSDALQPGIQLASTLDINTLRVEGGGFNLAPIRDAQTAIAALSAAFTEAQAEVADLDTSTLLPVVAEPIGEVLDIIETAEPTLDVVNRYLPTLLDLAGANGTNTYLLVFQNNAEIRATGGNPAASMVITVDDGKFEMVDQSSSATFYAAGTAGTVTTELPADTLSLHPSNFNKFSQDFTLTPDFPTTAELFQNLWLATSGTLFDGVISVDPVVLSNVLEVVGPVVLASGEELTSDNVVKTVLSDSYERYPGGTDSDAFFAEVAKAAFTKVTAGGWDPAAMLEAMETSAAQQRLLLHFENVDAEALANELGLTGALQTDNTEETQLGIYLNDYTIGKLEYQLAASVSATCDADARTITVSATLTNSIPDSIRSSYTLGARSGNFGLPRTTMMLDVLFFAPPGAEIMSITPENGDIPSLSRSGVEKGNSAESRLVTVAQGETRTVSYTIRFGEGPLGALDLRHTPTVTDTPVSVDASCEALFSE